MSAVFISLSGLDYLDSRHRIFPIRLNLELPVIDHLSVLHYGRLARDCLIPLVAVRRFPLHVKPRSTFRKVRPTDGLIIMRDPDERSVTRQIIESPQKFSIHLATSWKRHRTGIAMRLQLGETPVRSGLRVLTVLRDSPIDFKPSL